MALLTEARATDGRAPGAGAYCVPGLQRAMGGVCEALAEPSRVDRAGVEARIARLHRLVEEGIRWRCIAPGELTMPMRAARAWLAFFVHPAHLDRYLHAAAGAGEVFRRALGSRRRFPRPVRVQFRPQQATAWLRADPDGAGTTLRCATPLVGFDRPAFEALAEHLLRRRAQRALHDAMRRAACREIASALERLAGFTAPTAGRVHDLSQAFDRVNAVMFNGAMRRPALAWVAGRGPRVFGRYDTVADRIVINTALDQPGVSAETLDYVLYHELLHKRHGLRWSGDRACAHTAAFRAEERRYPGRARAEAELARLADGGRAECLRDAGAVAS